MHRPKTLNQSNSQFVCIWHCMFHNDSRNHIIIIKITWHAGDVDDDDDRLLLHGLLVCTVTIVVFYLIAALQFSNQFLRLCCFVFSSSAAEEEKVEKGGHIYIFLMKITLVCFLSCYIAAYTLLNNLLVKWSVLLVL